MITLYSEICHIISIIDLSGVYMCGMGKSAFNSDQKLFLMLFITGLFGDLAKPLYS